MKNRFLHFLRRHVRRQDHLDDAFAVDPARLPDFLRGGVSADGFRQAFRRFNDLERDSRQLATQRLDHAGNNAICYLTADGAVFGPIGGSFRVRTRKGGPTLPANDILDSDNKA